MSRRLISHSPDLQRLQNEGYDLELRGAHLLIKQVPYINPDGQIRYGTLVTALTLAGDRTTTPADHIVRFAGEAPCDRDGQALDKVINNSSDENLGGGLVVNHLLSNKPAVGYPDYHAKMTSYVRMISGPALARDATVTAMPFPVIENRDDESPFVYLDTASSRAGITAVSEKFLGNRVAIVGLGGTGSYVLDLVAKTPVAEIHLFDGDVFGQHNAFRAPGAATIEELKAQPFKVDYLARCYSALHRHVIPHQHTIGADTADEMRTMNFVFLTIDDSEAKRDIVAALERHAVDFIDTGMGLHLDDGAIAGILRVTKSTRHHRDHVHASNRIPFAAPQIDDQYGRNIQVADLNVLNAALAVVAWKKHLGFYRDLEREHFTTYTIDGNHLMNEDQTP